MTSPIHSQRSSRSPGTSPNRFYSISPSRTPSPSRHHLSSSGHSLTPTPSPSPSPSLPPSPTFTPQFVLHGHTKPVSQVRISPDGKWIASSSADATIKIWDSATGEHIDTLVGHLAGVNCVAWAPDSRTLASGSDDKAIRLWDRVTGRPMLTARGVIAERQNAAMMGGKVSKGNLRIMDPLLGHHSYVHCLAFSPKGNVIASGSYDEAVFLWDVRAGRLMRSLPAHSDPVSGIDFSPDGTLVVSCSTDGLTRIWDATTGQCLRTLVHEDNPPVANVLFSPNGRFVLAFSFDNCVRLWDYVAGTPKKTYQGHRNTKYALGGSFGTLKRRRKRDVVQRSEPVAMDEEVAFIAAASEDGGVILWDVKSKLEIQRFLAHEGVCIWVDVHGDTLVSCGLDGTVRVYRNTAVMGTSAPISITEENHLSHEDMEDDDVDMVDLIRTDFLGA